MRCHLRVLSFAFVFALAVAANAEIAYRVVPNPDDGKLAISITVPNHGSVTDFQIPSWSPGAYVFNTFWKAVSDLAATDSKGKALTVTKKNDSTWSVAGGDGPVTVSYTTPCAYTDGAMHYSGPSNYLYVVDRKNERCKLTVDAPSGWPVYTGLDEVKKAKNTFTAPTYDVLADNPVSTGDLLVDQYTVAGKPHYIVLRGAARGDIDRAYLLKACKAFTSEQADFFGGLPYHKYVWHFSVNDAVDGGGGLEHLSSTQIGVASGMGYRVQSVLSHEFFHLWNVKRIRAFPLGPFDYTKLPKTGALWWLEGVTDYYAWYLPYRYQWWDKSRFLDRVIANMDRVRANPARLEVSANEASLRVGEANEGRGNSNGFKISYYDLGWLAGMCLDLEIRSRTNGRRSLDDVERALWAMNKDNQPGFQEDLIRKQCIRFGGASLGPFYDRVVMTAGEMPIEEQLAKAGLKITEEDQHFPDLGITYSEAKGSHGEVVSTVSGVAEGKLLKGDIILAVNGRSLNLDTNRAISTTMSEIVAGLKAGTTVRFHISRDARESDVEITPADGVKKVRHIIEDPAASTAAITVRNGWLATRSVPVG